MYLVAGQFGKADQELDRIIAESRGKFTYDPFVFLGHYYKGLVGLESGNSDIARKAIKELTALQKTGAYDLRFDQILMLLTAETDLATGDADRAATSLQSLSAKEKLHNKGLAYEGIGNKPEAMKSYTSLVELMKNAKTKLPVLVAVNPRLAALRK